ncbi:unnamed protein product [Ixodes pacificus]
MNPPATHPYDKIKEELIKRTTASEQRRLQQLLTNEELGDRKPSQLLRSMRQLLGDRAASFDDTILRERFLQRIPSNARMILATSSDISLDCLAELADKILDIAVPSVATTALVPVSTQTSEVQQLREEVRHLTHLVEATLRLPRSPSRCSRDQHHTDNFSTRRDNRSPRRNFSRGSPQESSPNSQIC